MIDLHIHTSCSDGQFSPSETIEKAFTAGVTAAAVTDHDTISGIAAAAQAAEDCGMQFFSGIEISVQGQRELHILGYGIDPENRTLLQFCEKHAADRKERSKRLLAYLQQQGIPILLTDVQRYNNGSSSGRPHFARALMEMGYASSIQDAFDRYLTTPAFYAEVERPKPTPEEGIRVIRQAGGAAVLAHPHQLQLEEDALEKLLQQLIRAGLQGIEAYYSLHTPAQTKIYLELAHRYDLLYTCGSDYHGPSVKPQIQLGTGVQRNLCVTDPQIPLRLRTLLENHRERR